MKKGQEFKKFMVIIKYKIKEVNVMNVYVIIKGCDYDPQTAERVYFDKELAKKYARIYGGEVHETQIYEKDDELRDLKEYSYQFQYVDSTRFGTKFTSTKNLQIKKEQYEKEAIEHRERFFKEEIPSECVTSYRYGVYFDRVNGIHKTLRLYNFIEWDEQSAADYMEQLMNQIQMKIEKESLSIQEINIWLNEEIKNK